MITGRSGRSAVVLGNALSSRENALNFVRLLLASSVIVAHATPIMGVSDPSGHILTELGNWAVNGFFVASGYLITGSRLRLRWGAYLWRRFLRIFPAYWVALILVAFVLAPLVAAMTSESLIFRSALGFPVRNAFLWQAQDEVANTLTNLPIAHVWLGTAWTLFYEFAAYLVLGALLSSKFVRENGVKVMAALSSILVLFTIILQASPGASSSVTENFVRLGAFFFAGSLMFFLKDRIRITAVRILMALLLIVLLWTFVGWERAGWFAHLPLAYVVLGLGAILPWRLGSKNDISYGIYLYGWPAQQLIVLAFGATTGVTGHVVLALLAAIAMACASWFVLEKPALKLVRLVG